MGSAGWFAVGCVLGYVVCLMVLSRMYVKRYGDWPWR